MNKIETDRKEKVVHVMEISNEKLTEMAALDIKEADISLLSDLKDIKIDESAPDWQYLCKPYWGLYC